MMTTCARCGCVFDLDDILVTIFVINGETFEYRDIVPEWENQEMCEDCTYDYGGEVL